MSKLNTNSQEFQFGLVFSKTQDGSGVRPLKNLHLKQTRPVIG